jgi:hypothetical protein
VDTRLAPEGGAGAEARTTLMPATFFDDRFLLAVALLAGLAALKIFFPVLRARQAPDRRALREYLFLLATAAAGAVFAAGLDSITSRLSPEYFTLGKGLPHDAQFALRVVARGVQSGTTAGVALGAVLLFAVGRARPAEFPHRWLFMTMALVTLAAASGAALAALIPAELAPLKLDSDTTRILGASVAARFNSVRTIHLGAYAGALAGTVIALFRCRRLAAISPAD